MAMGIQRSVAALAAVLIAGSCGQLGSVSQAQAAEARNLPAFEVDSSWPKVPPKWRLGDASSIAIDAQDNVYVLHRPATLKPDQAAMAAPPVEIGRAHV